MSRLIAYYFSSLVKQLIVLLFFCSFIPLILSAFNYPPSITKSMMIDTIFISFPWLLWFQQAIFCGFTLPQTIPLQIFNILMSTILSTIILMSSFPFTQRYFPLKINTILPNIIIPNGSIIPTQKGTLIIDPISLPTPSKMFAQKNSKALWIDSNYIVFDSIKTNDSAFTLSKAHSFSIFGYYPQKGTQVVPFNLAYPSFPQYSLGQYIIQTWFDNMNNLNNQITSLYTNYSIPIQTITNINFQQILQKNVPYTNQQQKINSQKKKGTISKKTTTHPIFTKFPSFLNYLNIALSILIIFTSASFIGIFLTIKQNLLGASALLLITSLYVPSLSLNIITSPLQKIFPTTSLLATNSLLILILYICCFISITIKKHILKENTY